MIVPLNDYITTHILSIKALIVDYTSNIEMYHGVYVIID